MTEEVFSAGLSGTRIGALRLWATSQGVRRVDFARADEAAQGGPSAEPGPHLRAATQQISEYLEGQRRAFDVALDLDAVTAFQRRVYERLLEIPFGQVVTYGRVAGDIGEDPLAAARAVGQAVGANPLPLLIPCHRVIGADGRLTGFSGGPERKAVLLALEGVHVEGSDPSSRVRPEILRLPL